MATAGDVAEEVLAANAAFYRAFATRDVAAMDALWARKTPVACIHPGWQVLTGRTAVMTSWRGILENPDAPEIACTEARAHVFGAAALVVCTERLESSQLVASNVFVREDDAWRLVHHQAGPVARDIEDAAPPTSHEIH
jgi:ketosteroid isomerase-like protein